MANPVTAACSIIDAKRAQAASAIAAVYAKFSTLRRMIQLAEGLVYEAELPVFGSLPSVSDINIDVYENLRSACPMLGLKPSQSVLGGSIFAKLDDLKAEYTGAIQDAVDKLERHPLGAIDKLEQELNLLLDTALPAINKFDAYLQCACATVSAAEEARLNQSKSWLKEMSERPASYTSASVSSMKATMAEQSQQLSALLQV